MAHVKIESLITFCNNEPEDLITTRPAKSPDEVKQFIQTFAFPVQFKTFDQANGWHIQVVKQFMQDNNLVFKEKKDYN
eukprot:13786905-Ditylum_brightwellii.AAC.1